MPAHVDISGRRFGRLTALQLVAKGSKKPYRNQRWLFLCDCGNETEAVKNDVVSGHTQSCGCLHTEITRQMGKQNAVHGHARRGKASSEYATWVTMRARCENPNVRGYQNWGGRGIRVCPRWNDFEAFFSDMGLKPSPDHEIDRIDNDGNYEPSNCRWATPIEQANNMRSNRRITIGGREATIAEHARESNIDPDKLRNRIDRGWSPEILAALLRIYRERATEPSAIGRG
jgi:hypothetical protein